MIDENIVSKSTKDFLVYANAVIKSRAIPSIEDNAKPVHRRILWTFYKLKIMPDKKTVKSARVVGECMGKYHPHGDMAIYDAMIRLGQWWKMRYPLVYVQGNAGTILGDGPAASRYTECKLSEVGALMLEDINKNCVPMRPNYDESEQEPAYLPSKFPNILCNGNSGIAVGISSGLLPHNYNEVADAISYYIDNQNCSTADLMKFIKGPDFPTGGQIINGEELLAAYESGVGVVRVRANYKIETKGNKTELKFFDLPYGVELEDGVTVPLKKLVNEEGYEEIEDFTWAAVNGMPQVTITLAKNADVQQVLNLIFAKTRLQVSIKMNNVVIVNKEPKLLNLKGLIQAYIDHRSMIITNIAKNDLEAARHRLTVVIGLQKCLSDIDTLISLIRNADNRAAAKMAIMKHFELTDEQAEAILEIKLARLSRLDIHALDDEKAELEAKIIKFNDIITNYATRAKMIKEDLKDMRQYCKGDRLTTISINADALPIEQQEYKWYNVVDGKATAEEPTNDTVDYLWARSSQEIVSYGSDGTIGLVAGSGHNVGAFTLDKSKKIVVSVTKNGQIKATLLSEYNNFAKRTKVMKIKDGDELVYVGLANKDDYILIVNCSKALKLPVSDLTTAGKLTVGVKCGITDVVRACVVNDSDILFMGTADMKGHLINAKDFSIDSKGNKGQTITENTAFLIKVNDRGIIAKFRSGKPQIIPNSKLSLKGKTAIGASVATKIVTNIC